MGFYNPIWRVAALGLLTTAHSVKPVNCPVSVTVIEIQPYEIVCNGVTSISRDIKSVFTS